MDVLTCPLGVFKELLQTQSVRRDPTLLSLGWRCGTDRYEWFVRGFLSAVRVSEPTPYGVLSVQTGDTPVPSSPGPRFGAVEGDVILGPRESPFVVGVVTGLGDPRRIGRLSLIGSGMHRLTAAPAPPATIASLGRSDPAGRSGLSLLMPGQRDLLRSREVRWSRTIGAVGGVDVWRRLTRLHVAIIGCGRTGSLMAGTLVRLGIRRLTLVDDDHVEFHNLGEMDHLDEADLGLPKVHVVARGLRRRRRLDRPTIVPIPQSVLIPAGIAAIKRCDVLVACPDNDGARLAAAVVATRYQRILIDVGVGVLGSTEGRRGSFGVARSAPERTGADVRLIVPGDGCLMCRGGVSNLVGTVREQCGTTLPAHATPLRAMRLGSLASLNQIATGLAAMLLQDLVAEKLERSTWAHVEFDSEGRMTVVYPAFNEAPSRCELCAQSGSGDV
jgi:molybdopterin/thiamine biosynthesis adenylyltransferase